MNPKINPEYLLAEVNTLINEIRDKKLLEKGYREGSEDLNRIIQEIEGLLRVSFSDNKKRISKYHPTYINVSGMSVDWQGRYISEVKKTENNLLSLKKELELIIDSKGYNSVDENVSGSSQSSVTQLSFNGPIENLAMGDIHNYDINIYLKALESVIENSDDIPSEEKKNLIDKIRSVANNDYVKGIGTGLIVESIKLLSSGF